MTLLSVLRQLRKARGRVTQVRQHGGQSRREQEGPEVGPCRSRSSASWLPRLAVTFSRWRRACHRSRRQELAAGPYGWTSLPPSIPSTGELLDSNGQLPVPADPGEQQRIHPRTAGTSNSMTLAGQSYSCLTDATEMVPRRRHRQAHLRRRPHRPEDRRLARLLGVGVDRGCARFITSRGPGI
jgi:hypothetical protein